MAWLALYMLWVTLKAGDHLSDRLPFVADLIDSSEQREPEETGVGKAKAV